MLNGIVLTLAGLLLGSYLALPYWREMRRQRIRRQTFPETWERFLLRRVPLYRKLPPAWQQELKKHILVFLAEKQFEGCGGLVMRDEIRVTIAAQACMLLLNKPFDYYPSLRSVLVYPSGFAVQREVSAGYSVGSERVELAGESWPSDILVLSWEDIIEDAFHVGEGVNVVLHEFAHQLDAGQSDTGVRPVLPPRIEPAHWADVFGTAYRRLQERVEHGDSESALDSYGAESPAEFFAVATEAFFDRPEALQAEDPELYRQLSSFYNLDPIRWTEPTE